MALAKLGTDGFVVVKFSGKEAVQLLIDQIDFALLCRDRAQSLLIDVRAALSPRPLALGPQPSALGPQLFAPSPQPSALGPPQPSTLGPPQPSALGPLPPALHASQSFIVAIEKFVDNFSSLKGRETKWKMLTSDLVVDEMDEIYRAILVVYLGLQKVGAVFPSAFVRAQLPLIMQRLLKEALDNSQVRPPPMFLLPFSPRLYSCMSAQLAY